MTSEHHGIPVHILIISSHHYYLLADFLSVLLLLSPLHLTFVNNKTGEIDNLSNSLEAKLFVSVCRSTSTYASVKFLAPMSVSCSL